MGLTYAVEWLREAYQNLIRGYGIRIVEKRGKRLVRVEWLNLVTEPRILQGIAYAVAEVCREKGYNPDAVSSIETSGAKYGVATSIALGIPYFSIHKLEKIIFTNTVSVKALSQTEGREVELFLDRDAISRFHNVILVDDIRRTSRTIDMAVELLQRCGCRVEACFTVFDFKFANHPLPSRISPDRYHPLFIISAVGDDGRCVVEGGEALRYVGVQLHEDRP